MNMPSFRFLQRSLTRKKITMVKALRQLANATLLVEFSVMQLTMDLHEIIQIRH